MGAAGAGAQQGLRQGPGGRGRRWGPRACPLAPCPSLELLSQALQEKGVPAPTVHHGPPRLQQVLRVPTQGRGVSRQAPGLPGTLLE